MLSPKARNLVALIRGVRLTVTGKLQEAPFSLESTAPHPTSVRPSGNAVPVAGTQVTVTGAVPPVTTGLG
jgi:hypothetical protein